MKEGVSFVVPVYNGARWLEECLRRILAQADGRPMEVIVVDDGSSDNSLAIVKGYEGSGRVRLLHGAGRGAPCALNRGIRAAAHPVICQVDEDVLLEPGWLAHLLHDLEEPGVAAAQGCYRSSREASLLARVAGLDLEERYRSIRHRYVDHVCTGNTAYRGAALREVGLFDESLGYGYDNDMSYRLGEAGYRLVLNREARSLHGWPETAGAYLAQQYGLGYGRLDLVAKHRHKMTGDDVSGLRMILHVPAMALALSCLGLAGVNRLLGGAWSQPLLAGVALLGALALDRLLAGIKAAVTYREPRGLFFVPAHLLRDLAWVAAGASWVGRRLLGRRPNPQQSMFRPRDGGQARSSPKARRRAV